MQLGCEALAARWITAPFLYGAPGRAHLLGGKSPLSTRQGVGLGTLAIMGGKTLGGTVVQPHESRFPESLCRPAEVDLDARGRPIPSASLSRAAVCGTACTVVWEGSGGLRLPARPEPGVRMGLAGKASLARRGRLREGLVCKRRSVLVQHQGLHQLHVGADGFGHGRWLLVRQHHRVVVVAQAGTPLNSAACLPLPTGASPTSSSKASTQQRLCKNR